MLINATWSYAPPGPCATIAGLLNAVVLAVDPTYKLPTNVPLLADNLLPINEPPVIVPVALINPTVLKLPPFTLPVASTRPPDAKLPPVTLPVTETLPVVVVVPVALAITTC